MAKDDPKKTEPEDDELEDEGEGEGEEHDEEDEEEDVEDAAPAKVASHTSHRAPPPPPPQHDGEDPSWWLPHAVLGTLVLVGVLGFFGAFNTWLKPLFHKDGGAPAASAEAPKPEPKPATTSAQRTPPPADPATPTFGAKHLVVQFQGATRSKQTRTKDEAKARAEEALKKAKGGAKFEDVVGEYSDEPGAKQTGGNLGRFRKGVMDPAFTAAVEKLKVGEMSEVVESPFGFHVIVRTE